MCILSYYDLSQRCLKFTRPLHSWAQTQPVAQQHFGQSARFPQCKGPDMKSISQDGLMRAIDSYYIISIISINGFGLKFFAVAQAGYVLLRFPHGLIHSASAAIPAAMTTVGPATCS